MIKFLREWTLVIAILAGVAGYFIFVNVWWLHKFSREANFAIGFIQPALIFSMLFLTFCKVDLRGLRLHRWHLWLLLIQAGAFTAFGCMALAVPDGELRVVLEGVMICMICPTATAGAVVTRKLGGDVNGITAYTMLINIGVSVLIPSLMPFIHPHPGYSVVTSALMMLARVFPLLLLPLVAALILRVVAPKVVAWLGRYQDLSFYLWALALALAIAVTTRSIVHSTVSLHTELWLVAVSCVCCALQFFLGRLIGGQYGHAVTGGQSLGQKNTVLAIWMGYTFFTPVTAMVGGFYSVWHNVFNSWQLYKHEKCRDRV